MTDISGVITNIVFRSDKDGWTVADIKTEDGVIRCTGKLLSCHVGRSYRLTGDIFVHPKFGEQFKFTEAEEVLSETGSGIAAFLASDLVKGVGPKTAEAIVSKFGTDTFDIIENEPDRLTDVKGVTKKKADRIRDAFLEYRDFAEIEIGLQKYGITPALAMKLYSTYGTATLDIIEENPYELADDIDGIGFKRADAIAMKSGIPEDSPERVRSAIIYILQREASMRGNMYLPDHLLYGYAEKLTGAGRELCEDAVTSLLFGGRIMMDDIDGEHCVYLSAYCEAEKFVAARIMKLKETDPAPVKSSVESLISEAEAGSGVEYSEEQRNAIRNSLENSITVITDGPGTGKTTIISAIARILESSGLDTEIAAPTGRAAKRIKEAAGLEARTIHRLLEYHYDEGIGDMQFGRGLENPLRCKAVIIDEASMIDIFLMDALLRAVSPGARLILVGDADQLPPVGAGNVFADILDSGYVFSIRLNEIFRQAEESMIVVNAHRINAGEYPIVNGEGTDFFLLTREGQKEIMDTIADLCSERLPSYYKDVDMIRDIQVLSPVRKQGGLCTAVMNGRLQEILNPPDRMKREKQFGDVTFREGDKVMQIKNDYDLEWKRIDDFTEGEGIFNGDIGYISEIDDSEKTVRVVFEDVKYVTYEYTQLNELELAYAITVHKSQGSEFPVIVMPVTHFPPMLAARNLLYTAVTRGKKLVVLVGSEHYLDAMVDNNMVAKRYSGLAQRLKAMEDPWADILAEDGD